MVRNNREEWKTRDNVFDGFTERLLFKLQSQGHFDELESLVAPGKEANVFVASKGSDRVIVKIYRLENCNFNTMHTYIRQDPRYVGMPKSRRKTIFSWVQREYRNLLKARELIRVPKPIVFRDHVLVMEFIGHSTIAPLLKDKHPENPQDYFDLLIADVRAMWQGGLVHGDLSQFNILNSREKPVIIDFSQSTTTDAPDAMMYLERDVKNVCQFFRKLGVEADENAVLEFVLKPPPQRS